MADTKISALTSYTPPLDADVVPIVDTANTTTKKVTWSNIKVTLKTYFDTLYQSIAVTASKASTFTFNGSGGTSGSVTMQMQKIGNWVTLYMPPVTATTGTNSSQFNANTAIDAAYRPTVAQICQINTTDNGGAVNTPGVVVVGTNGILSIRKDYPGNNYTNSSVCGSADGFSISYYTG